MKSFLCCSEVRKGDYGYDLFDLYLSRDSEVCRVPNFMLLQIIYERRQVGKLGLIVKLQ